MAENEPKKVRPKKTRTQTPRYVDEKAVSTLIDTALPTLRKWRSERRGPSYVKIGRMIRYDLDVVQKFMDAHRVELDGRQDKE